ncbi:hypothetical protein ACHHYP_08947 [Achlya hypogyna]|uniref:Uncharacterized protein n=1 Tax=Achlya hypogyna TaxID=1202772 RepID=A0A1V9ZJU9_ACHHY|nr:hypothetical protein ACHHYP_08947 [Achlya hypogyna]
MQLASYFTVKDYADPYVADYISPARMHLFQANAEEAEPLATTNNEQHDRDHRVRGRVTQAIHAECAVLQSRLQQTAVRYLASAIDRAEYADVAAHKCPYTMWQALAASASGSPGGQFRQALTVQYDGTQAVDLFLRSLEAAVGRWLRFLQPHSPTNAATVWAKVEDQIRCSFLAHALTPPLADQVLAWWRNDGREYEDLRARLIAHLAVATKPNCHYCHSKKHADEACYHLSNALRDGIVREGYTLPEGQTAPGRASLLCESSRRFCTYCQSTKHRDAQCTKLADDTRDGCVRGGYQSPPVASAAAGTIPPTSSPPLVSKRPLTAKAAKTVKRVRTDSARCDDANDADTDDSDDVVILSPPPKRTRGGAAAAPLDYDSQETTTDDEVAPLRRPAV